MTRNGTTHQATVDHTARIEKMQQHITDTCNREHREFVQEWIRRLAAERQAQNTHQSPKRKRGA